MRLLKGISRQVGENEYFKWTIIIPPSHVEELGWKEGQELEGHVRGKSLTLRPLTKRKEKIQRMSYRDFKEKVVALLRTENEGLSWTEVRQRLQLPQRVPNNLWVRMMEKEIGLYRQLNNKSAKVIWTLKAPYIAPQKEKEGNRDE